MTPRPGTFDALTASMNAYSARHPSPTPSDDAGAETAQDVYRRVSAERAAAHLASLPRYDLGDGRFGRSHRLTGRCADGYQLGGGTRFHIVAEGDVDGDAICGSVSGNRSGGWSREQVEPASCPGCVARLARITAVIRVGNACSLPALWDALKTYADICDAQIFSIDKGGADLDNLPTFGGDRPTWRAGHPVKRIFSWDECHALVEQQTGPRFSLVPRNPSQPW
ncbi:hypothetical protein MKK58_06340 [Methylobacterium sp. J-078]|uniref:hypothetical protein n=1 Tax=Methylobacterium sp. J-078 TaxID=2836657 RepID=UPI001FBAF646|nr:hypothetical protein [Methylobacterium sp. J-078]MCJ2044150.1 hypothetical protein [Methylobacterium sp. J-078]